MHVALSRTPESRVYSSDRSQFMIEQINTVASYVIPEKSAQEKYKKEMEKDSELQLVKDLVLNGWPPYKMDCPAQANQF